MSTPIIANPRQRISSRTNFEMWSWLFMRISGVVLVLLVIGHLVIMNIVDGGVQRINFAFVSGRLASPFWQMWDLLQLWLAMIHGSNGLRTIINDYAEKPQMRFWLRTVLSVATVFILVLGTYVIFTFDPNIA